MWLIPSANPEGKAFIAIIITFLFIAILACGIRVYSRRLNRNALDASDCMCFIALVRCSRSVKMLKSTANGSDLGYIPDCHNMGG